jgi:hypothetical protein
MVKEEKKVDQPDEAAQEQLFTPEPFSPLWNHDPVDLLDIDLSFPYSSKEWDTIFTTLIDLLNCKDPSIRDRAINKLSYAVETEASQHSNCDDYQPKPTDERVKSILKAIAYQALDQPDIFEAFCSKFKFLATKEPYSHLICEWLGQLAAAEDRSAPTQAAILAAQILFGVYDSTWQEAGATLLALLDHPDLNVRACAAYQIGRFYKKAIDHNDITREWDRDPESDERDRQSGIEIPPLEVIMQLIRSKELERPGVAGAFWHEIPKAEIDAKEWLLDVLAHSPELEPTLPYFPCSLAFDAHERFSRDAEAVRRLMEMGRVDVAIAAATDESDKIAALEPVLIELGYNHDPEVVRLASWQLAYYYHYLHPRGAELGYVELVSALPEIDLFLLFNHRDQLKSPYAVVIYPRQTHQMFSQAVAQQWVDVIFPDAVRGDRRTDLPSILSHWYQRGYVAYHGSTHDTQDANSGLITQVIIGYRSRVPWNPKQFLLSMLDDY